MGYINFQNRLAREHLKQMEDDFRANAAIKAFADKLQEARHKDALEFYDDMRACAQAYSGSVQRAMMEYKICQKLKEIGYYEAAQFFENLYLEDLDEDGMLKP